jgi:hypothetical protein
MDTPADLLQRYIANSDIEPGTKIHDAISNMLEQNLLNIAGWYFKSKKNSHSSRSIPNEVCPALHLAFKYKSDLIDENIDPEKGNWDDEWGKSQTIREALNAILISHNLGSEYVSDRVFIFVGRPWEHIVMDNLGRIKKDEIKLVISEVLPNEPKYIFWHSSVTYYLVFKNKAQHRTAQLYKPKLEKIIERIFSIADPAQHSRSHQVALIFLHMGMKDLNLFGLSRQD